MGGRPSLFLSSRQLFGDSARVEGIGLLFHSRMTADRGWGYFNSESLLRYVAALALAVSRHPSDLVPVRPLSSVWSR